MTEKTTRRRQAKFYLSQEAISLLAAESERSTYPMSTLVDMFIKDRLGEPNVVQQSRLVAPGGYQITSTEDVAKALGLPRVSKPKQEAKQEKEFRLDI